MSKCQIEPTFTSLGHGEKAKKMLEELTKQNKDFEQLAENILLIPLRNGLGMLPQIFQALADVQYKYKVFDGEPIWFEGPMDLDTQTP